MEEIWKDIPGYEGLYQVSDQGRIKRLKITTHEAIKHLQQVGKNSAFINGINI